jgi:hypothetical protein
MRKVESGERLPFFWTQSLQQLQRVSLLDCLLSLANEQYQFDLLHKDTMSQLKQIAKRKKNDFNRRHFIYLKALIVLSLSSEAEISRSNQKKEELNII